ncbi:MAG: MarR family transcriptional regulator [Sphingomonadales bacterium]|nr:MAG: MarR family transcriptional regulator [Sphingomonadales bacterium]
MIRGVAIKPEPEGQPRASLGRLGKTVGFRMRRVQIQFSNSFAAKTAEYGMRSGLFSSLAIISGNPGMSQQELSRVVGLDKSVTVQIVDELENRGFARRERSKIDRRRHSLKVTPDGEAFIDKMFAIVGDVEDEAMQHLSAAERASLHELLDRMYDILAR